MRVSHARRPGVASDGRTIGAQRRMAKVLPTLTMSVLDATPALRRLVAPHRVTVAEVRTRFCHSRKAPTTANRTRSHVGEERITDHPNRAAAAPHPTATPRPPRRHMTRAAAARMRKKTMAGRFMAGASIR